MRWQWLVIATIALLGAAGGVYFGNREAPDEVGVAASLGLAGLGLGGLVGVLVSGWWKPPRKPPAAAEPSEPSTTTEFTAHAESEPEEAAPAAHEAALVDHPPPPPPPDSGEPGWYKDQEGVRRYWDGERWTEIVWRERRTRTKGR
ncbi:DUF2510 domain-containing protein [Solirubrobacter sp. CPCC 204708]|uniref:DUF2510 domain-containing protein n=1 Tax=Solirubrobacter deserti TaxID=2282478 RepID=A0ABT4RF47_9ACTN|nr:DUF2510 domain-containing protein [Solirubrobacter deserti]MBE2319576.1 DUF2510 domain-containing protein [Solirubrobacter deserti]MDA0137137.1 DUF2510 domain-containing protein [Solirubrobacter deserti]